MVQLEGGDGFAWNFESGLSMTSDSTLLPSSPCER